MPFYKLANACGYQGRSMEFYRVVQDFIPSFFIRSGSSRIDPLFAQSLVVHFTKSAWPKAYQDGMLITHQQKGNKMTVSLTKTPEVIRITKSSSDLCDEIAEVHRVTKRGAVVCYVKDEGYRTYQEGEYEVIA